MRCIGQLLRLRLLHSGNVNANLGGKPVASLLPFGMIMSRTSTSWPNA